MMWGWFSVNGTGTLHMKRNTEQVRREVYLISQERREGKDNTVKIIQIYSQNNLRLGFLPLPAWNQFFYNLRLVSKRNEGACMA